MPQPTAAKTIKVAIFLKVLTFLILIPSGLALFKHLNHFLHAGIMAETKGFEPSKRVNV